MTRNCDTGMIYYDTIVYYKHCCLFFYDTIHILQISHFNVYNPVLLFFFLHIYSVVQPALYVLLKCFNHHLPKPYLLTTKPHSPPTDLLPVTVDVSLWDMSHEQAHPHSMCDMLCVFDFFHLASV